MTHHIINRGNKNFGTKMHESKKTNETKQKRILYPATLTRQGAANSSVEIEEE